MTRPHLAPTVLLIHGTGASTHSWRGLSPLLAQHFNVLAIDLPGHAFTDMPTGGASSQQLSLPGMAVALGELLKTLGLAPALLVGHSAGAAIAVRMCLDGVVAPQRVISLNGAFLPLRGLAGQVFSPVAKLMSAVPFVPTLFSWRATDPAVLKRLIDGTGSVLDAEGIALYGQLVSNPGHVAGDEALQEFACIGTGNADNPAAGELAGAGVKCHCGLCVADWRQLSKLMTMAIKPYRAALRLS